MRIFYHIGKYTQLIGTAFRKPEKLSVLWRQFIVEVDNIGIGSLGIVALMSVFMGAVIALQTASNIDGPLIPMYTVGFTVRQSVILEFSPTIISLILAGKVGSNIASELGTMRVTEQIDALEIMGVNSAGYLILPKILAGMAIMPFLIIISMFLGMVGGYFIAAGTDILSTSDYIYGLRFDFKPSQIPYALIKTVVFGFLIITVSSYQGYYVKGGSIEVGRSSTRAVVMSSILILIFNYLLTQIMLI